MVRLVEYRGPHVLVANAGLDDGLTYGLITNFAGLICLTPDGTNREPHDALEAFVGRETEILGITEELGSMVVVAVTVSREL